MHAISGVIISILPHIIIVSMHIDIHIPQSSIHRRMEPMSIFIVSIGLSFRVESAVRPACIAADASILLWFGAKNKLTVVDLSQEIKW
jgi:hypothetical protein